MPKRWPEAPRSRAFMVHTLAAGLISLSCDLTIFGNETSGFNWFGFADSCDLIHLRELAKPIVGSSCLFVVHGAVNVGMLMTPNGRESNAERK
jgi:hypothetical protein